MDYQAIAQTGRYHVYAQNLPDKEKAGLVWHTLGLIDTNEILVIGELGNQIYYKKAPAGCLFPHMEDRRFGMDIDDMQISYSLSNKIFEEHFK